MGNTKKNFRYFVETKLIVFSILLISYFIGVCLASLFTHSIINCNDGGSSCRYWQQNYTLTNLTEQLEFSETEAADVNQVVSRVQSQLV